MSTQVGTALVQQYNANIEMLAQQMGSRLRPFVTEDSLGAEYGYFDQIGASESTVKVSRHADLTIKDTPHARRRVSMTDIYAADYVDAEDKLRMLQDPTSEYITSQVMRLGRDLESVSRAAADGTAYTGKSGATAVTLPAGQEVAVNYVESGGAVNSGLTIGKLRAAAEILWSNEAIMDGEQAVCALTAKQLNNLLRTTEVTSSDYNAVKALVNGQLDTFMGFKFIRTQLLGVDANDYRKVLVFPKSAIKLAVGRDIVTNVDHVPTKGVGTYLAQAAMTVGATRMQEVKVVRILCSEV